MLTQSECRLVVTERGSTDRLDPVLTSLDVHKLLITLESDDAYADDDLGIAVAPDQLAYIYFTSGSTGTPKGAMCEHAGMLNHLYAKVDDLQIGPDHVVAQTAPQCFDISLWQLLSALLVGGRTLLVEQDTILDVRRFINTIDRGRVATLQVVPSYLDVVLSYLEQQPRDLRHLRCVSATGEPLKQDLAQRWFATMPGIPLINAYGLTETSDDTNHEVMHSAPDRILLGPPINNVRVSVVDERLCPVPLGATGEIVFSGLCVGRGYVNDVERTRQSFLADPHRTGERLYRSGDFGRWQPGGKLEYLGRGDSQVKIAGFRIEIGEIENALSRLAEVSDAAVVVAERPDHRRQLVAFYTAPEPVDGALLRDRLGAALPAYLIPSTFQWCDRFPLTGNGKIDRKALASSAEHSVDARKDAPHTETEQRLAVVWSTVLNLPVEQVGRRDSFFDLGGTSLAAVRLVITLDRRVSLQDIVRHPALADLATLLDSTEPTT